ncbi:MAG: SDR family NAD(P)-dependent oxidoreductase, partial [Chloroflexi bacterium]
MRTAIVTGANRGIGREIARQLVLLDHRVILTSRDEARGNQTIAKLKREIRANDHGEFVYHQLDVTNAGSIKRLHDFAMSEYVTVDILVNNAAVLLDQYGRLLQTSLDVYRDTLETNLYGPLMLCQTFIPMMLERNYGRVVNVSSGAGQVEDMINDMT